MFFGYLIHTEVIHGAEVFAVISFRFKALYTIFCLARHGSGHISGSYKGEGCRLLFHCTSNSNVVLPPTQG